MRPPGTPVQLQQRRLRAVRLLQAGRPLAAVARQVQASVSSVWRWWQAYQRAGLRGLQPQPTPGRPPRLSGGQQRTLMRLLARGPRRAGFPTDLWTLARVAKVIHREFGIRHHPSHVWKMLTARGLGCQPFELSEAEKQRLMRMLARAPRRAGRTLDRWTFGLMVELFRQEAGIHHPSLIRKELTARGWRCPRPERHAVERNEAAVDRWESEAWPGLHRYATWRRAGERNEAAIDRWESKAWPWIKKRYTTWRPSRPRR